MYIYSQHYQLTTDRVSQNRTFIQAGDIQENHESDDAGMSCISASEDFCLTGAI